MCLYCSLVSHESLFFACRVVWAASGGREEGGLALMALLTTVVGRQVCMHNVTMKKDHTIPSHMSQQAAVAVAMLTVLSLDISAASLLPRAVAGSSPQNCACEGVEIVTLYIAWC